MSEQFLNLAAACSAVRSRCASPMSSHLYPVSYLIFKHGTMSVPDKEFPHGGTAQQRRGKVQVEMSIVMRIFAFLDIRRWYRSLMNTHGVRKGAREKIIITFRHNREGICEVSFFVVRELHEGRDVALEWEYCVIYQVRTCALPCAGQTYTKLRMARLPTKVQRLSSARSCRRGAQWMMILREHSHTEGMAFRLPPSVHLESQCPFENTALSSRVPLLGGSG